MRPALLPHASGDSGEPRALGAILPEQGAQTGASPPVREAALSFETLILFTLAIRLAAHYALAQPLASDGLAYFTMAKTMAAGGAPLDNLGQHAFHSILYPALLTPFFALFGASVPVAFGVNLLLACLSATLVRAIARDIGLDRMGQHLAMLGHAVWLPGIWNCTLLARENLSTPLMLATVWLALRLLREDRDEQAGRRLAGTAKAAMAGAVWALALLAGVSAAPIVAAPVLALALARGWNPLRLAGSLLAMAAAAALMLGPWLLATTAMLGAPLLTTNAGFNLYLGNNPAASERFVSIAQTPAGPGWHALRAARGELGASTELGRQAQAWMLANPERVVVLSARKLALFWAPNLPKPSDFAASRAVALVRILEVVQYVLFAGLGALALVAGPIAPRHRAVIGVAIGTFWALHGLAYIVERYRDPAMPLLIIAAASLVTRYLRSRAAWGMAHAA